MTRPERQVYLLDPKHLSPETIAVTFAKTSRSPQRFAEIAADLTDEKSAEFHEKWVVGYGHASVAEHAILHIAVENISRLAVESLESCRLASYTEKSTRYQKWSDEVYHLPEELNNHPLNNLYESTIQELFAAYQQALPQVKALIQQQIPAREGESEIAWERRVRSRYVDVCRFYLPAAALANVGVTINARALEHLISKMLSHPLAEVRQTGEALKSVGQACAPTLIKYANPIPYLENAQQQLQNLSKVLPPNMQNQDWCNLVSWQANSENRVLAAALYREAGLGYAHCLEWVESASPADRSQLTSIILDNLEKFTIPLRELEYATFTFDLILDQGAYFELKRHRMMTQTPQPLNTLLGYAMPRAIVLAGLEDHFRAAMNSAHRAFQRLAEWNPGIAAYVVPNAFNRRVLLEMNLRSADHLLALRSADNAHFSVRRVVQRMAEQLRAALPLFAPYLRCNPHETWQGIQAEYFAATNLRADD
ncbi:MAG: FAD-dependent thymidylate synthase [Bellilinea sp.]|jgi:thymidylate synthase ThyX